MTDRVIVYDGAVPQATDMLNASKFAMLGDAFLAMATLGNSGSSPTTVVAGLACTPTSPATLNISVGPGAIFQLDEVDATGYGDLGTDTNSIFKMGIREAGGTLAITPPSTTGYSQVYLVQAILQDADAGATVLSYYNSSNPTVPFSGPANAGTSQNTTRTCICAIALKAGVAAPTGTQTSPSPDAGYTALYYITVANGATQITTGNIVTQNGGYTPFVGTALPYIPSAVQAGNWVYSADFGTADALIATLVPTPTSYNHMMIYVVKGSSPNATTTPTLNVNGLGAKTILRSDGSALAAGDLSANSVLGLIYDGTNFRVVSSLPTTALQNIIYNVENPYFILSESGTGSIPSGANTILPATVDSGHFFRDAGSNLNSSNANAFTCGSKDAGMWLFIGIIGITPTTTTQVNVAVVRNGGTPSPYQSILAQATVNSHMTFPMRLVAGDYVQISGFQNSGSSLTLGQCQLIGIRIGA